MPISSAASLGVLPRSAHMRSKVSGLMRWLTTRPAPWPPGRHGALVDAEADHPVADRAGRRLELLSDLGERQALVVVEVTKEVLERLVVTVLESPHPLRPNPALRRSFHELLRILRSVSGKSRPYRKKSAERVIGGYEWLRRRK